MNPFTVSVKNDKTFELTEEQAKEIDIVKVGNNRFHLINNHQSYHIELLKENLQKRSYTVKVNEFEFEIGISTPLEALIKALGFELGASKRVSEIKAPMPGLILSLKVEEGQEVEEGQSLLILEAMKMENNFNSPRAGTIKSIAVKEGQAVDKGQILIEFE